MVVRGDVVVPAWLGDMLGGRHAASSPSKTREGNKTEAKMRECREQEGERVFRDTEVVVKTFGTKVGVSISRTKRHALYRIFFSSTGRNKPITPRQVFNTLSVDNLIFDTSTIESVFRFKIAPHIAK